MNALSHELVDRLIEAVKEASEDRDCRSIILTGAGEKAFCAGTDLKERRALTPEEKWAQSRGGWRLNQAVFNSPKAVIAAVGGWCLGGGRSEEHTSELQSLMRISYAVFCLKKKNKPNTC